MSAADEEARRVAWLAQQQKRLRWLANDIAVTLRGPVATYDAMYANYEPLLLWSWEQQNGEQPLEWFPDQLA